MAVRVQEHAVVKCAFCSSLYFANESPRLSTNEGNMVSNMYAATLAAFTQSVSEAKTPSWTTRFLWSCAFLTSSQSSSEDSGLLNDERSKFMKV